MSEIESCQAVVRCSQTLKELFVLQLYGVSMQRACIVGLPNLFMAALRRRGLDVNRYFACVWDVEEVRPYERSPQG